MTKEDRALVDQGNADAFIALIIRYESVIRQTAQKHAEELTDFGEERIIDEVIKILSGMSSEFDHSTHSFKDWLAEKAEEICNNINLLDLLLEKAKAGDTEALGTLIMHYKPAINTVTRKYIHSMTGFEMDDVFVEVFIRAQENVAKFEKNSAAFKGWLCITTKNFCYEVIRKLHPHVGDIRISVINIEDFVGKLLSHEPDPSKALIFKEEHNCAKWAYASLSQKYQDVLNAKYNEQKKYKQIAKDFRIPIGTVSKRIHVAMQQFKEKLGECEEKGLA